MATVTIDTNSSEDFLFDYMKGHYNGTIEGQVEVFRNRLDVADARIASANGVTLFVERKTWADWCASLCDGRYREQKKRFLLSRKSNEVFVYVIEGSNVSRWDGRTRGMSNKAANAAVLKTQLRDGIPVIRSCDKHDTENVVAYLSDQVIQGTLRLESTFAAQSAHTNTDERVSHEVGSSCQRRKRKNLEDDPRRAAVEMLSSVAGVGARVASDVLDEAGSVRSLARMESSSIAEIKCGSKGRRLGSKVAERICAAFS